MARLYIGRSTGIGSFERYVVLKVILPERANDHIAVQMFLDEARLAASLNHQNVAQVFEVGEEAGIHFLAMEYVHGQDLRALLAKAGNTGTRVPLELALTVVAGAAAGLEHAHERRTSAGVPMGIVHRDVSPSNIMIGYDGAVKLLDFGIAKASSRSVETQSGVIKGKFAYMSPEQCRGRAVDRRSDVFSLGIILYEVTTQHRCFRADSDFDTMHRIVTGDVIRPTRLVQGYPQALEAIILSALTVDPNQRYQTAGLLLDAIESFAIATRISLSTMSLGRFMRDMFGDVQEPWLASGRIQPAPQAQEQTISNTSAGDDRSQAHRPSSPSLPYHEDAPLHLPPESAALDVPHHLPPVSPAHQPPIPLTNLPPMPPAMLSPLPLQLASSVSRPPELAGGTQQIPPPPFAMQSGSSAGPLHGAFPPGVQPTAQPIVGTRQGYTGAPDLGQSESSYPRYAPPAGPDVDLHLQSNHRLLYAGIGAALIFIIVMLIMLINDSESDDPSPPAPKPTTSSVPSVSGPAPGRGEANPETTPIAGKRGVAAPEAATPQTTMPANGPAVGPAAIHEESISIRVESVPPGADVLFAGKPIGTTPLETKVPRSTGYGTLTVHRAKFQDVTTTIDLSSDYHRALTLTPIPDAPAVRPSIPNRPAAGHDRSSNDRSSNDRNLRDVRQHAASPPPPAKKCQSPDKINPYDTSCGGQPCPPCKVE
jgi:serine/threonine protein kinase